jgi:hypothetical protein
MKKVIAVMVIMAVFSTAVFAAPLSVAGSLDKSSKKNAEVVQGESFEIDAFFGMNL